MTVSPAWSVQNVTQGGSRVPSESGSTVTFRANHPSEAKINFDNTDNTVSTFFAPEDEVKILMNNVLMFDGYVYNIEDIFHPNRKKDLNLYVMDWGSYLASKRIFERDYQRTKFCKDLLLDAAAVVSGLSTAGVDSTGLGAANFEVKGRRFQATYVKDVWYAAADTGGFDFFVDENKVLQAWPFELNTDGSGNIRQIQTGGANYKIVDYKPTLSKELMVRSDIAEQIWSQDTQNKYRTVKVTNAIIQTYPAILDIGSTDKVHLKGYAYEFSAWWNAQGTAFFDAGQGTTPKQKPFDFVASENLGSNSTFPSVHLFVGSDVQNFLPTFRPRQYNNDTGDFTNVKMQLVYNQWNRIGYFMNLANLTGQTITGVQLQLRDLTTGGSPIFTYDYNATELADVKAGWIYHQFNLPTANNPPNGIWSASPGGSNPNFIDSITWQLTPQSGYNIASYIGFSNLFFEGMMSDTETSAGSPTTQKIIVNRNLLDIKQITNFATRELLRTNTTKQGPRVLIDGFDKDGNFIGTDFRKPGYKIDIDLTQSFGTGRSATSLRINEIEHKLTNNMHYITIVFDNSFYRP